LREQIKVAFASGTEELNARLTERMEALFPELPLYVVSEFPPPRGAWVQYHPRRGFAENYARCRAGFKGKRVRLSGALLVPQMPYRRMRLIALLASPLGFVAFNENLDSFMLRPRDLSNIVRHLLWRCRNLARYQLNPGGPAYTFLWRLARPAEWKIPLAHAWARAAGAWAFARRLGGERARPLTASSFPAGVSVVIPSRNGRHLLEAQLPSLLRELEGLTAEIIVVDNGSDDSTGTFLAVHGVMVESSAQPLSFAAAVNRGIARARYSRVLLLNNDMQLEPDFFGPLLAAFSQVPDLFCATAQILFPAGVRREETGKAVMRQEKPADFPVRCLEPLPGEDLSYVLYGSGGCSLYDSGKLRALGGVHELFAPAYVEDLDLGYRAWQRGWPTVFVSGARVVHRHRATTSRYYTQDQLDAVLEVNYLRFLATAVANARVFRTLWDQAIRRLHIRARLGHGAAVSGLIRAGNIAAAADAPPQGDYPEDRFLALGCGDVAVFPGELPRRNRPMVLVVSPWPPYPLAHGGAVRMYNLMRRAARDFDQVLVAFHPSLAAPPRELLEICNEVVFVQRTGTHSLPPSERPDEVEQHSSAAFRAALELTVRKWRPDIAQLELTHMAQYAEACAPARTVLVEHDITLDLYEQLARETGGWDTRRQLERWRRFETQAWRNVDAVVTMSAKDAASIRGARVVVIPNGVDLERFQPALPEPDPRRMLFIGSFAHLPNLMALEFFLREVWPRIENLAPALHVIAGARREFFLDHYRSQARLPELPPAVELEGFVADVRPAYARAAIVIAPLVASAGTNIKILEAMAMGKAIVSTPAGINGLDLRSGHDLLVTATAEGMARAIRDLFADSTLRRRLERTARRTAERDWGWDRIAERQRALYESIGGIPLPAASRRRLAAPPG
jgi:GT2 family glycosyltransferase/glycosyltransferase involved in cell wall biosynthesis